MHELDVTQSHAELILAGRHPVLIHLSFVRGDCRKSSGVNDSTKGRFAMER